MNSITIAIVTLLIAMVSIQAGASLAKSLFPLVGPEGTTALRLLVASLLLCVVFRPWKKRLTKNEYKIIAAYGISLGAMNYLFYLSLARIPLGIAVALEFTGPLAVALYASRKLQDFVWALLAIAGILLILPISNSSASIDIVGGLYALGAGTCWAGYIIFGQRAGSSIGGGTVASLGMLIAALLVVPFGVFTAGKSLLHIDLLPMAVGVGIFSSALPYSLEMLALKKLPAKNFGILMSLEPAIAALSGLIFLGEKLTVMQWFAIVCIMTASGGSAATARAPQNKKELDTVQL